MQRTELNEAGRNHNPADWPYVDSVPRAVEKNPQLVREKIMADDNNTASITEGAAATTSAEAPAPKKTRGPRRQKAAADVAPAPVVKSPRGRRKKVEEPASEQKPAASTTTATAKAKGAVKQGRRLGAQKQVTKTAPASVSARDDMADLIQLEEENSRLRKTLAEKLRSENADLRKRLGLN